MTFIKLHFMRVVAIIALTVISACATTKKPVVAPVQAPPPPVIVQPVTPPPPPVAPVIPPRPQVSNALKVAVLVPMSGGSARIGQSIANAANLALLDLNTSKMRLTVYDTDQGASQAANTAIAEGAKVILGPLFAQDVRAVQAIARNANVPVITFSNDIGLAQSGTWILGFQPSQEVARVVDYAHKRGINRFGALVPQGRYGEIASKAMSAAVLSEGGSVGAIESYPRDRAKIFAPARRVANYEARLTAARGAAQAGIGAAGATIKLSPPPFDALLIPDTGGFLRALIPLLKGYGVETPRVRVLGTSLWAAEPGLHRDPGLSGAWYAAVPDAAFNQMARRFNARFGYTPPRLASLGYDSVLLVATAARNWSLGESFPTGALSNSGGFAGVDGIFRFNGNNVAMRGLQVEELNPAGLRVVSPAPSAFGR